jgi:hypothetical protein
MSEDNNDPPVTAPPAAAPKIRTVASKAVVLLTCLAGESYSHKPGTELEFSADEADRHVAAGNARELTDEEAALRSVRKGAVAKGRK